MSSASSPSSGPCTWWSSSGLAAAVFLFIGHRATLRHDYVAIINGLFGSSGGPDARKGLLGDFRHLFIITPSHLYDIGFLLVAYATLEAVEMVGLWFTKRWAEYLTFVATTLFVPLEVYELLSSFGWLKVATLVINLAVVLYLLLGKRLFGLRGGRAADLARRQADGGWEAIERRPPEDRIDPPGTSAVAACRARSLGRHLERLPPQLPTRRDAQFSENVAQVVLDRFSTDVELLGHLGIRQALGNQSRHITFTVGQVEW